MSFLRGTIKDKLGFTRQFKQLSLNELDFGKNGVDDMLDDLSVDEEPPALEGSKAKTLSKKRGRSFTGQSSLTKFTKTENVMKQDDEPQLSYSREIPSTSTHQFMEETPATQFSGGVIEGAAKASSSWDIVTEQVPELLSTGSPSTSRSSGSVSGLDVDVLLEDLLEDLENVYLQQRSTVVRPDGFISTPVHALKIIGRKFNEPVLTKTYSFPIIVEMGHGERIQKTMHRVEFFAGNFRGVGESCHLRLSAQMAAIDVLMRLERYGSEVSKRHIIPYAIFPGWRVPPLVTRELLRVCQVNNLANPSYILKSNVDDPEKPPCIYECYLGEKLISSGESDYPFVARKLAAAKAIEKLTGEKYDKLAYVALGSSCMTREQILAAGGQPPELGEQKKDFLLSAAGSSDDEERGIDQNELHEVCQQEMQLSKRLRVTVQTRHPDGRSNRKVAFG